MLFLGLYSVSNAQTPDIKKLEKEANQYFEKEQWHLALPVLLKLDSLNPEDEKYNYMTGVCYYNSIDKKDALYYFKKAQEYGDMDEDLNYYLGRAFHFNNQFDSAQYYYMMYREEVVAEEGEEDERVPIMDKHIESSIIGSILIQDSIELDIVNIGAVVNSEYPDYVPVLPGDESFMMFTSRREDNQNKDKDADGQYFEDIFITNKMEDGSWGPPENLGENINTWQHDACIGLSFDGKQLFIYKSVNGGDIYMSEFKGSQWQRPERVQGEVNSRYWESSATLTADGKYLYYTSDRPGGYGGSDIYRAEKMLDGSWGNSINLGPQINTEFDEDAPHIHFDGKTLFFSSRGHETMGGFDIFSSIWEESANSWTKATNVGYPINTADDDIYFALSADGARAFFSSYRSDTYGEKDLYYLQRPSNDPRKYLLKVVLHSSDEQETNASFSLKMNGSIAEEQYGEAFNERHIFILEFDQKYELVTSVDGYIPVTREVHVEYRPDIFEQVLHLRLSREEKEVTVETVDPEEEIVKEDVAEITEEAESPAEVSEAIEEFSSIDLKIVQFEFDKANLNDEAQEFLDRLSVYLNSTTGRKVKISGYTDAYGPAVYNKYLSEQRAKAAFDYLLTKNVSEDRMTYAGYGEDDPIADNALFEERKKNRRVEFRFLD